jgi:catechol 2,3-dioxygenase
MEVGLDAPLQPLHAIGLLHIAFRLRDEAHLRTAYDDLKAHGVKIITALNHGVTKSVYFRDPDGNQLEVYCDGLPDEVAKFPDPYTGMEKLDFAKDAPDFREPIRELSK